MDTAESHVDPDVQPEEEPDGRRRIGEIFVELGFITSSQLEAALEVQREKGGRIGEILVAQGSLTRLDLASALAEHWEPYRFSLPAPGRGGAGGTEPRHVAERDHAAIAELEERLRVAEERLGSVEGSAARGSFVVRKRAVTDLQERLAHVEQLVGSVASLNLRVATLEQSLDQLESLRESDAVATGARLASAEAALGKRLESVEGRTALIAELEEAFDALGLRLRALESSAAASATELGDRLGVSEAEVFGLGEALGAMRRDAESGRAGADRATSALKLEAGSLAARIDELRGLRSADSQELGKATDQLGARMDELARRLDAQDAAHAEHVLATERALLDGLTALHTAIEALEPAKPGKKGKKKKQRRGEDDVSAPESD